ncbi:hypothetical protein V8F33_011994 [Rhypophila sp. PSN 637]
MKFQAITLLILGSALTALASPISPAGSALERAAEDERGSRYLHLPVRPLLGKVPLLRPSLNPSIMASEISFTLIQMQGTNANLSCVRRSFTDGYFGGLRGVIRCVGTGTKYLSLIGI